jgi:glycosyltransferase involved in cell wall biosynthesis
MKTFAGRTPAKPDASVSRDPGPSTVRRQTQLWTPRHARRESASIVATIPVWNGAHHLPAALESLVGAADAVVALDDGSADETLEILKHHTLVKAVLIKPPKHLSEWDDAENRRELYEVADRFAPEWILCLDADERMECTFSVYRKEILSLSSEIRAIGFPIVDIEKAKITRSRIGHRMYRYNQGYTFDRRRLHCRLIPLEITPEEILETNIRIFNAIGGNSERKRRIRKYELADPDKRWQSSYAHLSRRFSEEELLPISGRLRLKPISEDGIQRDLFLSPIDRYVNSAATLRYMRFFQRKMSTLLPFLRRFHDYNLDAYVVKRKQSNFVAEYSFDSSKDTPVSLQEAWTIADIREDRDLFLCMARLGAHFKIPLNQIAAVYTGLFDALIEKKILVKPFPTKIERPLLKCP